MATTRQDLNDKLVATAARGLDFAAEVFAKSPRHLGEEHAGGGGHMAIGAALALAAATYAVGIIRASGDPR